MSAKYVKVSVKALLVSVLTLVMVLTFVAPVAAARPTDDLHWSTCSNRKTVKTKAIVSGSGMNHGTLYVYKCSNGIFARTSVRVKGSSTAVIRRSSPSNYLIGHSNGYHSMTNMLYLKAGACYYAHGSAGGGKGSTTFCM
ncbi:MAG: hypothetical protein QG553_604 [Patescibacteria group bacterium]|nr:hypothetical protein [Patescibacteria group bacterium]